MSKVKIIEKGTRNNQVDTIKGILIFIIVIVHVHEESLRPFILTNIATFYLSIFFLISGFFSKKKDFVQIIFLLFCIIFYNLFISPSHTLIILSSNFRNISWFLQCLVFYKIIFYFLSLKRKILIIGLSVVISTLGVFLKENLFQLQRFFLYLPYFTIGYYTNKNIFYKKISSNLSILLFIIVLSNTTILSFLALNHNCISILAGSKNIYNYNCIFFFSVKIIQFINTFSIFYLLIKWINNHNNIFTKFGNKSLIIYLFHLRFIFLSKLIESINTNIFFLQPLLYIILSFLICLLLSQPIISKIFYFLPKKMGLVKA
jgi:fucose 4-O-acetylase-like acetyltransferase